MARVGTFKRAEFNADTREMTLTFEVPAEGTTKEDGTSKRETFTHATMKLPEAVMAPVNGIQGTVEVNVYRPTEFGLEVREQRKAERNGSAPAKAGLTITKSTA